MNEEIDEELGTRGEMSAEKATLSFSATRMEGIRERKGITRSTLSTALGVTEGIYNWSNG